jgi:hypothetical protein
MTIKVGNERKGEGVSMREAFIFVMENGNRPQIWEILIGTSALDMMTFWDDDNSGFGNTFCVDIF